MRVDKHGNNCAKQVNVTIRTIATLSFNYGVALKNAEKLFGSNGIYFNVVSQSCPFISKQQALVLDVIDGTCKWNKFSTEQQILYDAVGGSNFSGILVAFVKDIKKPDGKKLNGCSGHKPDKPMTVIRGDATVWTMCHELGHILLGPDYSPVHHADAANIMYKKSSTFSAANSPIFNSDQMTQLKKSPYLSSC